jgi:hypothetical protein
MTTPAPPDLTFPIEGGNLVSKDEAATWLRLVLSSAQPEIEADLDAAIAEASEYVRRLVDRANDPAWDETNAPRVLKAAVRVYLENVMRPGLDRQGDEWKKTLDTIERLVKQHRDSALA